MLKGRQPRKTRMPSGTKVQPSDIGAITCQVVHMQRRAIFAMGFVKRLALAWQIVRHKTFRIDMAAVE